MAQKDTLAHIEQDLPARVIDNLYRMADKYRQRGVRLFIFGSFAAARNRSNSDLDIGIIWDKKRDRKTFAELYKDINNLPTVRKIDLVDMDRVDEKFKEQAIVNAVFL